MFFFFSKVLSIFLYPLNLILILGMGTSLLLTQGKKRILTLTPWALLLFFSCHPISQWMIQSLEKDYQPLPLLQTPSADAIVILGGSISTLGKYSERIELNSSAERLLDGIYLYKNKKAPIVVFTGGSGLLGDQTKKEAEFARDFLLEWGVQANDLILESESRNTMENADFTYQILAPQGKKKILLVTSAFHMKRSEYLFQKAGFEVIAYATDFRTMRSDSTAMDLYLPSLSALDANSFCTKEWIGILVSRWKKG